MRQPILSLLRTFAAAAAIMLCGAGASAQVDAQFTQYYEVPAYYNAAAIGTTDYIRIRGSSRMQWVGITRAPRTFLLAADMPLKLFSKRFGVGLVMQQECMGLYSNLSMGAQVAYKIKLWGGQLSAGLQIGFIDESFKGSRVELPDDDDYHQGTDEGIPTSDIHGTAFDIGAGVFYTHRWFWAGLSATHINQPSISMTADQGTTSAEATTYEFQAGRTLYFMAGSNIPINNTLFEIQPSALVKTDFTFTVWELSARVRYNKFLYAGLGYRNADALSISVGADYRNFFLGYSYDYALSSIAKASSGSHEIWAGYRLKLDLGDKNKHKHKSIRIL